MNNSTIQPHQTNDDVILTTDMTCGDYDNEDSDVETIVYRPRSYIECSQELEFDFNTDNVSTLHKGKRRSPSPRTNTPRGGFSEIKHNVMNMVSTPIIGRRRSKTIAQNVGDRLKHALRRTSSLDTLTTENMNKHSSNKQGSGGHKNHHKSMEDSLSGFSQLARKTLASKSSTATTTTNVATQNNMSAGSSTTAKDKPSNFKDMFHTKRVFTVLGKDRSQSCPSYPTIAEERLSEAAGSRKMIKSCSYDETQKLKCTAKDKKCPTIKVEPCCERPRIRNNSGQWSSSSISNSSGSLSSTHTVNSTSDNSSVFVSQQSLHKRTVSSGDEIIMKRHHTPSPTPRQRPRSFVDIFKQENYDQQHHQNNFFKTFHHNFHHHKNQHKLFSSSPKLSVSEDSEQSYYTIETARISEKHSTAENEIPRKLRSSTFSSQNITTAANNYSRNNKSASELCGSRNSSDEDNKNSHVNIVRDNSRLRAKSMNEYRKDNKKSRERNNNDAGIDVSDNNNNNKLKSYLITTPKTIKKLFKKKRSHAPLATEIQDNSFQHENEAIVVRENETNTRKCIHIESIV